MATPPTEPSLGISYPSWVKQEDKWRVGLEHYPTMKTFLETIAKNPNSSTSKTNANNIIRMWPKLSAEEKEKYKEAFKYIFPSAKAKETSIPPEINHLLIFIDNYFKLPENFDITKFARDFQQFKTYNRTQEEVKSGDITKTIDRFLETEKAMNLLGDTAISVASDIVAQRLEKEGTSVSQDDFNSLVGTEAEQQFKRVKVAARDLLIALW